MKFKGVTTQMKALYEYFLMVVFALLLHRVHVFLLFLCLILTEKHGKGQNGLYQMKLIRVTNTS